MCVAAPMRVVERCEECITVELGGARETASALLVPDVEVGDFVLVHAGFAIQIIDGAEAEATLALFREIEADAAVSSAMTPEDGEGERRGPDA